MTTYDEAVVIGDVVKFELDKAYCREEVILAQDAEATEDVIVGTILEASSTKKVPCTTGTNADSILLTKVLAADIVAGDVTVVALTRGPAIVDDALLTITANQKTTAKAALKVLGILTRVGPTYSVGLPTS